jgi:hypothetical protein
MSYSSALIAIAVCLFASASSSQKIWAQSFYSLAQAEGQSGPRCDHSSNDSTLPVVCHQSWQLENDQISGAGVSTATSAIGFLAIGASAACDSVFDPPDCSETAYAAAVFEDGLTFANLPNGQSFVNVIISAGAYTPNGESVATVSETVDIPNGGLCDFQVQGTGGSCSAVVPIESFDPQIGIEVTLQGTASVSSAGLAGFHAGVGKAPYPTGGSVLAIFVQDANGNRVNGVNVTSGSGYSYPSFIATATRLGSNPNPARQVQTVVFNAVPASPWTVPPGSIPTGTVSFSDGTNVIGTAPLNQKGVATFRSSTLSVGSHQITASYSGDSLFAVSTSLVLVQTVN